MEGRHVFSIIGILLFAALIAGMVFNGEITEAWYARKTRREFRKIGIHETEIAGLKGFERNLCGQGNGCACVLLVHGLGDSAMTWRKILTMDAARFPRRVHLIALDLPGAGKSPAFDDPKDLQVSALAHRFNEAMKSHACGDTTVVGNSFGGWIALWMGIDYGNQGGAATTSSNYMLTRVISLGGNGLHGFEDRDFIESVRKEPTVENLQEFQRRAYYRPPEHPRSFWKEAAKRAQAGRATANALREAQGEDQYFDNKVYVLPVEVRYHWGQADHIIERGMGETLMRIFKGGTLTEIPECGHLPQKECPDAVLSAIFS